MLSPSKSLDLYNDRPVNLEWLRRRPHTLLPQFSLQARQDVLGRAAPRDGTLRTLPRPDRNGEGTRTRAGVFFVLRHSYVRLLIQRERGSCREKSRVICHSREIPRERGRGAFLPLLGPANEGGPGRALQTIGAAHSFLSRLLYYFFLFLSVTTTATVSLCLHKFLPLLGFFFTSLCLDCRLTELYRMLQILSVIMHRDESDRAIRKSV